MTGLAQLRDLVSKTSQAYNLMEDVYTSVPDGMFDYHSSALDLISQVHGVLRRMLAREERTRLAEIRFAARALGEHP